MAWNGDLTALTRVLAELYPDRESAERLVDQAGVPGGLVAYRTRPRDNWHSILREAVNHGKVADVLEAALDDYPEHPGLLAARGAELQPVLGPVPGEREPWHPDQPPETLERLMEEQSSFLPVAFLEVGARRARAVARIERADGECGTGFLVEGRLLVTNHHVLPTADAAAGAGIDFGYQASADGLAPRRKCATTALDPGSVFVTSPVDEYDVTVVRVADVTEEGIEPLVLRRRDLSALRWANIVQHPDGGPKQVALYHNLVAYVGQTVVQYYTDTLPELVRVAGLRQRLERRGRAPQRWLDRGAGTRSAVRNEGIHVNRVVEVLERQIAARPTLPALRREAPVS